jgi:hypothetical protein
VKLDASPRLPIPLVSATVTPGAITGRVSRVRRTKAGEEAAQRALDKKLREQADAIAATRPSTRRKSVDERKPRPELPDGWHQICASVPAETIVAIDAVIARLEVEGLGKLSRSRVLRIAVQRLDVGPLIDELRRLR